MVKRNLKNKRFGKLVAKCPTGYKSSSGVIWLCKCDCGNYTFVSVGNLRSGNTRSCGCLPGFNGKIDITGKRFGRLVAIKPTKKRSSGNVVWECKCKCGNITFVPIHSLRRGATKSCGCLRIKHGFSKIREYGIWNSMRRRCYNPKDGGYKNYGGRGIKVCKRWRNSFVNFFDDMGKRPSLELTLDRIDNDGNYEWTNCRWATWVEQANNRRNNILAA